MTPDNAMSVENTKTGPGEECARAEQAEWPATTTKRGTSRSSRNAESADPTGAVTVTTVIEADNTPIMNPANPYHESASSFHNAKLMQPVHYNLLIQRYLMS